jgi:hypothetical protein
MERSMMEEWMGWMEIQRMLQGLESLKLLIKEKAERQEELAKPKSTTGPKSLTSSTTASSQMN